jgi:hypothetical protein
MNTEPMKQGFEQLQVPVQEQTRLFFIEILELIGIILINAESR